MRIPRVQNAAEDGFVLIEILVSALVLTIASAGVVVLLQTTTKTQAELRHNTEAYALAQEDQARLSSMRLSTLNRLDQETPVTLNKTTFTVRSRGVFVNDNTSTPSCGEGTSSADYVEITSVVTWTGMDPGEKAKIVSILSPSNGSVDPNNGTLAISVKTRQQAPVTGAYVSGGSGAISGYTDAAGCAVFADLPAGKYSVTVSGEAIKAVNKDALFAETKTLTVVGGDTKTENFEFDFFGTIPVNFNYRVGSSTEFKPSSADSVVVSNSSMSAAKIFWTPSGLPEATVNATPLHPFTSAYVIYPGSCSTNNPDPKAEGKNPTAIGKVVVPAGGVAAAPILQLPALEATVWTGRNEANKGVAFANADVWVRDLACTKSGQPVTRRYTTNSLGKLPDLGLPWGVYTICADTEPGSGTSGVRSQRYENVAVQNLAASTNRDFYLGSGTGTVSTTGSCP